MKIETKICSKCKIEKSLDSFRKQAKGKYGRKGYCKDCDNTYNKDLYNKNREFRILQIEAWNEKHPEKLKKYQENWKKRKGGAGV